MAIPTSELQTLTPRSIIELFKLELNAELQFANDLYKASLVAAENTRLESLKTKRFIAKISNKNDKSLK